jgi:hypothetical protein
MQAMFDKIASECVAVRLRMLNRVVTNIYDDALRSLDLKVSQMNILVAAAKMGAARPIEVGQQTGDEQNLAALPRPHVLRRVVFLPM